MRSRDEDFRDGAALVSNAKLQGMAVNAGGVRQGYSEVSGQRRYERAFGLSSGP